MNPTNQPANLSRRQSPTLAWMRRHLRVPVTGLLLASFSMWSSQVKGATYVWDPDANAANNVLNLGGAAPTATNFGGVGTWDTTALRFWNGAADQAWVNGTDTAWLAGLSGGVITVGAPVQVGGLTFTTGGYSTTLTATNTLTLNGTAPIILAAAGATIGTAGLNGVLGTGGLTKNGGGTLTVAGSNTGFSGAVAVNGGALTLSGTTASTTQLNTSDITLNFGTLNLRNDGPGSNTATAISYPNNVIINGNSTISVDRNATVTNNTISIPSLAINNSAVTFANGNGYGAQVTGTTTLGGAITTINSGFNPLVAGAAGVVASANNTASLAVLTGVVSGGALNKTGAGTVTLQGANTYTGGTNILAGSLLLNTSAARFGTGNVIVNPGATLGVVAAGNTTLGVGQNLYVQSTASSAGILRVNADANVITGSGIGSAIISPYGASFQLDTGATGVAAGTVFTPATGAYAAAATYSQNIDLNTIGSTAAGTGRAMLGAAGATSMSGTVSNTAGSSTGDIRFGGTGTLTLTSTNVFGTTAQTVQIGSPIGNAQTFTGGAGTFAFNPAATNSGYTGQMVVNKGATLQSTATAATTFQVFGTGPLVVLGGSVSATNVAYAGTGTNPQIQNSSINLYPSAGVTTGAGGLFTIDNSAITTAGGTTNSRLTGTTPINAYGGSTFSLVGSNTAATTTTQNTGAYGFQGGNVINLSTNTTAATNADGVLTIANLVRNANGTMTFTRAAGSPTAFGTSTANNDARINLTQLNGVATAATATAGTGMLPAWLVDQTSNTFLTYGANGIAPVTYDDTNFAAPAGNKLTTATGALTPANPTVFALQITGTTAMGGSVTINPTGAPASDGSGLIITGAATHTTAFNFGAAGAREAVIYNSAAVTLSGAIAATGLTKFGTANLTLTGVNTGLSGTLTVNQGVLIGSTTGYNFRPITLAGGGQVDFDNTNSGIYLNDVTVTGEGIISGNTGRTARINGITVASRLGVATAPVTLMINNGLTVGNYGTTYVSGSGTSITGAGVVLNAPTNWVNGTAATSGAAGTSTQNILGLVTGGAANTLNKWGNASLSFSNAGNTYSGGTVINGAGGDNRAVVRSLVGTSGVTAFGGGAGTPFGTGSITVNPAGIVGVAAPDNMSGNALVLNSDLSGLAGVTLLYGGTAALPSTASTTLNNSNLGGPFSGVLNIEAVGFSTTINQNTLWSGVSFLGGGNSTGTATGALTGTITPSTVNALVPSLTGGAPTTGNNVYRIAAGGGSTLNFFGAANQFTGTTDIQVGAINNVTSGASASLVLGNGIAAIYNPNNIAGNVYLNGVVGTATGTLTAGRNDALGTAKIIFNGGGIQADGNTGLPFFNSTRTLTNDIGMTGDAVFSGSTDLTLSGNIALADGQNGVTRVLQVTNTTGITTLSGVISNGTSGSDNSITKTGTGPLILGTSNSYTGFTNINAGTLVVTGDSNIPTASKVTLGGGALGAWTTSFTTSRDYILTAASTFDVGPSVTLTQAGPAGSTPGSNISGAFALTKAGLGTLTLNGINSMSGVSVNNGILQASGSANLGDTNAASAITLNGGTFRPTTSFVTNRPLTATSGSVDVPTDVNLTLTGVISGANFIKTGAGTFTNNTGTNTNTVLTVENGTMLFDGANTPFAAAATALNVNGGTLQITNTTAIRTVTTGTGTLSFGGGGRVGLQSAATFSNQLTAANINRSGSGTLIIDPGTSTLAQAGNTNGVRLIPSTLINTVAVASANVNGILPGNIVTQTNGVGGFATYTGANGIGTLAAGSYSVPGATGTLGATTAASTVDVTGAITAFTTPTQSVYALRAGANVAGGTLRISSVNGLTATNQGGVIINGNNTIAANLIFDPTAASGGSLNSGEGLVYVNPGSSASVSGNVSATSFVKFGSGTLSVSGASSGIINAFSVNNGVLKLGTGTTFNKLQTDLVLTNTGSLDLAGQRLSFNSLSNGAAVTGTIAGGTISNTSATAATFVISGNNTTLTTFAGQITETSGTISLVKSGLGTAVLAPFNIAAPDAGNNNFTGGTIVNQGTLTVQDPRALGSGTLTLQGTVTPTATTVNFLSAGAGINSTIITGTAGGAGLNVVSNGITTLNAGQLTSGTGNVVQFNNLALNEGQLALNGANSYRVRFSGTTTINGGFGTVNATGADFTGSGELAGQITGSGALVKQGSNYYKGLIISGTNNNYSGGTQIQSGYIQVTALGASDTPLGSGPIRVYPGAALRIGANNTSIATNLQTLGRFNSFGIVAIDNDNFNPATTLTSSSFSNAYGSILAITRPFYAGSLDQSSIGDGRSILAGGLNTEVGYLGTLAPGLGDGVAPRTYRVAGGSNLNTAERLVFLGADNQLNDLSGAGTSLQIGARASIVNNGAIQNAANTVIIRNSNSYTGGTWIGKGSGLSIETGGSPAGSTPLGSSNGTLTGNATNVEIFGTLSNNGFGSSFVNAATGKNSVSVTLRPGGNLTISDQLGLAAGGQGRWADTDANGGAVNLGSGLLVYNGAAGLPSVETIGTLSVTGEGRVIVNRQNDAGTATLIVNNLTRTAPGANGVAGGVLTLEPRLGNTATAGILGIPNLATTQAQQASGFVRLITNGTAPSLGGTTANGTGVTNTGMAPAWIIDSQSNTFVTYSPTAATTGFQPLQSVAGTFPNAGTLNPGQVGYNKVINAALATGNLAAGDIVDVITAANTLAENATIYALRTSQSISPTATANTLTITSGGLINNGALTFNPTITNANVVPLAMTLNFGTAGAAEALIYQINQDVTINATINATALTRFAPQGNGNQLILTGNNNITGPITLNAGILTLRNIVSNTGTALSGPSNGQDITLSGASTRDASRLILAGGVGGALGSAQASNSNATALLPGTIYVNGDSRIDVAGSGITQRLTNITIADRGVRSPGYLFLGGGIYVQGTTSLGANDNIIDATFDNFAQITLAGLVQGGTLNKNGNGTLQFAGTANTFSSLTVNGSSIGTATSIVSSLTQTGNPFGAGAITVNPGGALRIMNASNIAANSSITIKTDGMGLGSIGVSTNLTQTQLNGLFGTGAGKVEMTSTHTNYIGGLTLDANSWNSSIDIAALETAIGGTKKLVIGTSINPSQIYFNSGVVNYYAPTITSSSDNVIRLGAGGNQGGLAFGVGTWENVFGAGKSVEIGAATAANGGAATSLVNGNSGVYVFNTRNTTFNQSVTLNAGGQLSLENAYALGSGTIILNQNSGLSGTVAAGGIRATNAQTIPNNISVLGDVLSIFGSGDNAAFNGNVNLNPTGSVGGTKFIGAPYGNYATSNNVAFNGIISGNGVNVIKSGGNSNNSGSYIFRGANTYTGSTLIQAGYLFAAGNVSADPTVAGPFGMSDTPIVLSTSAVGGGTPQNAGSLGIAGQYTIARSIIDTGITGNIAANIRGQTLNTSVITGGIALNRAAVTGGGLALDNISSAAGLGGVLDVQGPITGTGSIQIGNGGQGIVRLSANANGISTSTYAGGTNIWGGRVQVAADASFTNGSASPTIISSPFGTGTLFLGRQGSNTSGIANQAPTHVQIDAFGGDRTIVNPLGAINHNNNTTINFGGRNNLTFSNVAGFDLNSDTTLRNRTVTVATQGTVTFGALLSNSGTAGANLVKNGPGTLVLTNTGNTQQNLNTTDPNYGTTVFVDAGYLSVAADGALGLATVANANGSGGQTHAAGSPSDVRLRGGVLQSTGTFSTNRSLILTAASGIDVTGTNTLTVANPTIGAFALTKINSGTLSLNAATSNTITNLTIGGFPVGGGTVNSTATGTAPFATSTVNILGGTLGTVGGAVAQSLTIPTVTFGSGSRISLNRGATTTLLTATALTRANQGTLIIQPTSALADLGAAATFAQLKTSTTFTTTNNMLATPTVVAQDPSSNDLTFVQYGANGFAPHTNTGLGNNVTTAGATVLADVNSANTVAAGNVDVYAVRTSANIAPTDTTSVLRIVNGGLILNGTTTPPNIGTKLEFDAGTAGTPGEAFIYVRGGQTGASIISGSFTSTNVTKSGGGTLLISSTGNVAAPTATQLRNISINEGTLQFAGQTSIPSSGLVTISPMDTGAFDLAGQSLSIAGLGNPNGTAITATGNVLNSGSASTLTLAVNNQTSTFNGLIAGNVAVTKTGIGTQVFGANTQPGTGGNTYSGGTIINAGTITSAAGLFTPVGALQGNGINSFGTGGITLAGGILSFGNSTAANEVDHGIAILTQGPNNGYDVTISANNNFGTANTTSQLTNANTTAWQGINSVTVASGANLNFGGGTTNVLVKGATTFAASSTINTGGSAVLSGKISASGLALTKIGGNTLFLTNTETVSTGSGVNSTGPSAVGSWNLLAGTTEVRLSDGGSNPFGTNAVTLNGATVNLRHDGDNLGDAQTLTTFASTALTIGSLSAASSAEFITSANATLNVDRLQGSAINKTVQLGTLAFGGALGAPVYTQTVTAPAANTVNSNYSVELTGGLTMVKNGVLSLVNVGANNITNTTTLTISNQLSGNGTFVKLGSGELDLNTVATNTGGTMLFQGTTNFGSFAGNTRTLSSTAQFAPGDITVNVGTVLRFNSSTNLNAASRVDVRSNLGFYGVVGIGSNEAISSFNLRAPLAGGPSSSSLITAYNTGAGVLAINNPAYTQTIDLSKLGDGTWYIGSNNNAAGVTAQSSAQGVYTGTAPIIPSSAAYNFGAASANNANNVLRLGGNNSATNVFTVGLLGGTANTLTDVTGAFGKATSLVIGGPATGVTNNGSTSPTVVGGTTGTVILNTAQNYTGNTLVNTGSVLEFRGALSTSGFEVFGTLAAGGANGSFAGGPNPVMRAGSLVRLDNTLDLNSNASGRWGDATQVNLDSSTFRLIGNASVDLREVVGTVAYNGNSFLTAQRAITGRSAELNIAGFSRSAGAMLSIEPTTGGLLGTDERVIVAGATLAAQIANIPGGITNGMVSASLYNNRDMQFLTYSNLGFVNAGFDIISNAATVTPITSGTNRVLFQGESRSAATNNVTLGAGQVIDVMALRLDSFGNNATNYLANTVTSTAEKFIIRSGGLLVNGGSVNNNNATQNNVNVTAGLQFGATGTPTEALIAVAANTFTIGDSLNPNTSGQITATSISKSGDGALQIVSNQPGFTGNIYLNRGTLTLSEPTTSAAAFTSNVGGVNGTIFMNGQNTLLNLRSDQGTGGNATTYQNSVNLSPGSLMQRIDVNQFSTTGGTTARDLVISNLTFGGASGDQGQTLTVSGGNNFSLRVGGTTDLGPVGFSYFNLVSSATNLTLSGAIQGNGTLVAEGNNGTLFLGQNGVVPTTGWTTGGGLIVTTRTVQANAAPVTIAANSAIDTAKTYLGSGPITLAGGALNVRVDSGADTTFRTYTFPAGNAVTVTGNTSISADRITGAGTNKLFAFPSLAIGGQTLTSTSGNTHSIQFNSTTLSGMPTFSVGNDFVLQSVKDNGANLYTVKTGGGTLWFNDASSTNTGGLYVNQGLVRFGNPGAASATATAGTGPIQLNNIGGIQVEAGANLPTAGQLTSLGNSWSFPILRVAAAVTQSNLTSFVNSASTNTQIRLAASNSNALTLSSIGDGSFFFGAQGAVSYTANTLGAGTAAAVGQLGYAAGATGGTYRLASNDAAATVFTLAPTTATSNVLTGTSQVIVGNLTQGGNGNSGTLLFNNTNDYTLGTIITRGSEGRIQSGTADSPLGTGPVDVFGTLRAVAANGSFLNAAGTANRNTITMHPGSAIVLDGTGSANNTNRWGNSDAVALNGSSFTMQVLTGTFQNEVVGAVTFQNGSRLGVNNPGSPTGANQLTIASLARSSTGTLAIVPADIFGTNAANTDNVVVTGGLTSVGGGVNMLPAYIVNGDGTASRQSFLADAGGGSNRLVNVTYTDTNFAAPSNTKIGDVTANTSLAGDASIFALRIGAFTLSNAPGQLNTITLNQSTVAGGGILANGAATINPNLNFNGQEAIIAALSNLTLNGDISGVSTTGITKFGGGALIIGKDQTDAARGTGNGYNNGWTINEGQLTPNTFGALGNAVSTNVVRLNASTAAGANAGGITGASVLRLAVNAGNPSLNYYTMGELQVLDAGTISYDPGANDRMSALGASGSLSNIVVTSTGGNMHDAQLLIDTNRDRSELVVGNLQIAANTGTAAGLQLRINNSNFNGANSSGLSVNTLVGVSDTRITKIGSGELYIRGDSSASFAGNISIEQGAIGVFHNNSLGSGTTTVKRYGVLDVQVANFAPTVGTIAYQTGGIERWSVDGARTGTLNLSSGTLQVNNDQTANTLAVTMGGGSIEAYLRLDDNLNGGQGNAVYRTLNSNITFNLTADSFLGQNINQGLNGFDNGRQPSVFSPTGNTLVGAVLEIKGAISGVGGITKQGYDTVTISGVNTYSGQTNVIQGLLRAGSATALPSSNVLSTTGGAVFDLNGYNQSIGRITSPASGFTAGTFTPSAANSNPTGSGYITNSALATTNTLSVGNGANGISTDFTYGGVIQSNIALVKNGPAVLNLTNANTYNGGTTINAGWLNAANTLAGTAGSATGTGPVTINSTATLAGAGTVGGLVTLNAGGTIQPGGLTAGSVGSPTSGLGTLTLGGLTINGGTLVFNLDTPGSLTDDQIILTGTGSNILNITATPTITITNAGGFTSGTYKLIDFANGGVTGFSNLPTNPASPVGGLILTTVNNTFDISLLVQANTTVKWTGAENQLWDLVNPHNVPKNWVDLTANQADFVNSLDVTFDNTATGFTPIVSGTVAPKSITFLNTTGSDYTLGTDGTGIIADDTAPTALSKLQTGGLTINIGTNTFSGGSTLTAGTTTFGASSTVVTGAITQGPLGLGTIIARNSTLRDNGTAISLSNALNIDGNLTFSSTGGGSLEFKNDAGKVTTITNTAATTTLTVNNTTTFGQVIGGSGKGIIKAGNGTLQFTAVNTYNGGTTVNAGTLDVTSTGGLASGSDLTVAATAAAVNLGNSTAQTLGILTANGPLNLTTATTTTVATLNGSSTGVITQGTATSNLSVANGTYAGTILGTASLTKAGNSGDSLTLTNGGSTYSNGTALNFGSITVGASTISGATITSGPLGLGTLAMAAGTSLNVQTADQTLANALTINGNISLGGTNDLTIDGTGLTVPTAITLLATSQITTAAGLVENFNSVVTDGAGTFALTKAGSGQLNLNNQNNSYTGITTINAGVLGVTSLENQTSTAGANNDSLGNSSNTAASLVINGATLQYLGSGSTTDRQMTIGTTGAILDASGTGAVVFSNSTAAGLTLSGSNTARTLTLQGSNAASNTLSALIANNGTGLTAITKQGTGTWRLANTASTTTGITTISGGVLEVTRLTAGGSASSIGQSTNAVTNLVFNNGATLRWVGDGVVNNDTTDRLMTFAGGNGVIDASPTDSSKSLTFSNVGAVSYTGAPANQEKALTWTGTGGTIANPNVFTPTIGDVGTGTTQIVKDGAGVWKFAGASTASDFFSIRNGTAIVTNIQNGGVASNLGASTAVAGNLLIGSLTSSGTLRFEGSGGVNNSTDRVFTVGAGGAAIDGSGASGTPLLFTSATALTIAAAATTPRTLTLTGSNSDNNIFTPVIPNGTGAGLTSLAKTGDGTWQLNSVNTYTGTTTVSDGTLKLGVNNAIAAGSAVTVSASNAADSATWNLQTFNQTSNSITLGGNTNSTATIVGSGTSTLTLGGNVVYDATNNPGQATISVPTLALGTAARTFTVGNSSSVSKHLTISSVISSGTGGALVKSGAGTLELTNANTFTGGTSINGGTLLVNNTTGSGTGTASVAVNSTGTLGGNGIISGAVTVNAGGSIAPGSSASTVGTLTLGSSLTLATAGSPEARVLLDVVSANGNVGADYIDANGSNWFASLPASSPLFTGLGSGSHDLISLTNAASTLTFGANGQLSLTTTGSYSWQLGDILNLFDWAAGVNVVQNGFNPALDIVNLPSLSPGLGWDTSRFLTTGALGVVPEPSRALLLFLGVFGLLFRRRRE